MSEASAMRAHQGRHSSAIALWVMATASPRFLALARAERHNESTTIGGKSPSPLPGRSAPNDTGKTEQHVGGCHGS